MSNEIMHALKSGLIAGMTESKKKTDHQKIKLDVIELLSKLPLLERHEFTDQLADAYGELLGLDFDDAPEVIGPSVTRRTAAMIKERFEPIDPAMNFAAEVTLVKRTP